MPKFEVNTILSPAAVVAPSSGDAPAADSSVVVFPSAVAEHASAAALRIFESQVKCGRRVVAIGYDAAEQNDERNDARNNTTEGNGTTERKDRMNAMTD